MARKEFLDYVWKTCVVPQLGYSFSSPHDIAYSIEALQQMNLAVNYSPLYWNCACLSVNAGSSDTDFEDFGDEEDIEDFELGDQSESDGISDTARTKVTNYGKVAKAIGEIVERGGKVLLPAINKAEGDFIPDVKRNAIIYGLQAINGINGDIVKAIINGRPYTSLEDFIAKVPLTNTQMINLIKAGAFDELERKYRGYIMDKYFNIVASQKINKKDSLSMANYNKAVNFGIIPSEFEMSKKMISFKKWIDENCAEKDANNKNIYRLTDEDALKFFSVVVRDYLAIDKDYCSISKGYILKSSAFKKFYEQYIGDLKQWLASKEATELFYLKEKETLIKEWKEKYCKGSISKWEMDSLNYYYTSHELAKVSTSKYNIQNFNLLPETPVIACYKQNLRTGVSYPVYNVVRIAGTVLNADKAKHIVTLLTTTGVVDVKFYKFPFLQYNKRISKIVDGKKQVIENSWFSRGNKLLISGIRKENMFIPRKDFSKGYNKTLQLIVDVKGDELVLKNDREKGDSD